MQTRREIIKSGLGLAGIIAAGKAPAALVRSLIASRAALTGGKKAPTAKSYVQDDLVALWDGVENAGWGVRDASSKKWTNLCSPSKNTFSVIEGKSFFSQNSFEVGNGFSQIIGAGYFSDTNWSSGGTLEVCLRLDSLTGSVGTIFGIASNSSSNLWLGYATPWNVRYYFRMGPTLSSEYQTADTRFVGSGEIRTYSRSALVDGSNFTNNMFIDGENVYGGGEKFVYSPAYQCCMCSDYEGNQQGVNGGFHCIRVYSRALTAAEIAANYAIDKKRFNLAS